VILPETNGDEAKTVAQRIRSSLETENFSPTPDKKAKITISIGVTQYFPKEELSAFIRRADRAMYLSKKNGRNRVSVLLAEPPVKSKPKA
jgi:diguanylate cyclase (GGDEF)-like protein